MSEIILIALAIGVSIVSSVIKARKKAAAQEEDRENTNRDPWEGMFETAKPYEGLGGESPRIPHFIMGDDIDEVSEIELANNLRVEETKARREDRASQAKAQDDNRIMMEAAADASVVPDFNLRDAVIYSEILKPKF